MANLKRYLHASAVALSMAAVAIPAVAADPEARAREHYDRATELFNQGNYPAALLELQRAGELRPSYKLFHSIAQVHVAMNDPAAALSAYRKYLDQGGTRISAERRRQVTDEMAELGRRVGTLTVSTDVAGAEVWVDDARVGTTPLRAPLLLNVGQHRITLRHASHPERSRRVTVVGGATDRFELSLREKGEGEPSAPVPAGVAPAGAGVSEVELGATTLDPDPSFGAEGERSGGSLRRYAWIGWVATGVLAAGATATGLWALSSDASLEEDREAASRPGGASRSELESSASDVRALATATDVLWIAAAAAGGVSLWLTFGSKDAEGEETSAAQPLRVRVGATGVSLDGSF
jgi:hypothetical protein